MRFQILGPLRVHDGTRWSPIPARQQRVVLAMLLIDATHTVTTERLVYEIWGEQPPRQAVRTVQGYVFRLRRLLGCGRDGPLTTHDQGYALAIRSEDIDASVFERLLADGQSDLAGGRWEAAAGRLAEALALWRGPVLADVPVGPATAAEAVRLDLVRLDAQEAHLAARLELGRCAEVAAEAERLVLRHPLRERLQELLITALFRGGRRSDALAAYQQIRRSMVAELGLEPGPRLRDVQKAILAADADDPPVRSAPVRTAPASAAAANRVVPAQLPADVVGFTGRTDDLARLDALLPADDPVGTAVVISAIAGAAGIGKTALAVHWAHRVRDRFSDGQLYLNLQGYSPDPPLRPIDALTRFLPALGVPVDQVPDEADVAAALYRSVLADKRVLVVLDNARDADQIRPLLPGSPGCLVLVTSRTYLGGLVARDGAVALELDALAPADSHALLTRLLGPVRTAAEPTAVADLARLCGHLPLALRIAAANLAARPTGSLAAYGTRLATGNRLAALAVDGDPHTGVRAAFDLSYAALPGDAQRLFRLLGVVAGPDLAVAAAAALAGSSPEDAAALLELLARAHLVEARGSDRYACHDLLRLYAAHNSSIQDSNDERDAALDRLDDHYVRTVDAAARRLYPQMLRLPVPHADAPVAFDDHAAAQTWLMVERPNLVAAAVTAEQRGAHRTAWLLADALRGHLYLHSAFVDWQAVASAGLAAAETSGDHQARAAAHIVLATLHYARGQTDLAIDRYALALALTREAGWLAGESAVLGNLGGAYQRKGQLRRAVEHYGRALAIDERIGAGAALGPKYANLAYSRGELGELDMAVADVERALVIQRENNSRDGEADSLALLGELRHGQGRYAEAYTHLTEALAMVRVDSRLLGEASAEVALGALLRDMGRLPQATTLLRDGHRHAREAGSHHVELAALLALAGVELCRGAYDEAIDTGREALVMARATENRMGEVEALLGLALAQLHGGGLDGACEHARIGLALARERDYRVVEGQGLGILAAISLRRGDPGSGMHQAEQALASHVLTGHRLGAARAHLIAERCLLDLDRPAEAGGHRGEAERLCAEIGVAVADQAKIMLPRVQAYH